MNLQKGDKVIIIDDKGNVCGEGLLVDDSKQTLYGIAFNDGQVLYWLKSWCKKEDTTQGVQNEKKS